MRGLTYQISDKPVENRDYIVPNDFNGGFRC